MIEKTNIFDNIQVDKKNENFFEILHSKTVKIEKIVSNGQKTPKNYWYNQDRNEFVIILDGFAKVEIKEGDSIKEVELSKGDYLDIKANIEHRVSYTCEENPTVWLAVFYE